MEKATKCTTIPIIDLFAGPGGLGEGFSSYTGSKVEFEISLSIEKDPIARETLKLRSFFRKCSKTQRQEYYRILREGLPTQQLYDKFPDVAEHADSEAWCMELCAENSAQIHQEIQSRLRGTRNWVLIGGPPCQAYSLVGRSRNAGNPNYREEDDPKHTLYREYLDVIAQHKPSVFVMENVKGLLSSTYRNERILERILADLRDPVEATVQHSASSETARYKLYSFSKDGEVFEPRDFVLKMEEYGIPQARHRIIILGVREDLEYLHTPLSKSVRVCQQMLKDFPELRSGISKGSDGPAEWYEALQSAENSDWFAQVDTAVALQIKDTLTKLAAPLNDRGAEFVPAPVSATSNMDWFIDHNIKGYLNHSTRSHIVPDLHRYLFASCFAKVTNRSPKLSEFPRALLPNHKNAKAAIFEDRFRVQVGGRPSSTITSHISKDGHYFIHYDPRQCRSLTVREAARLQTFPDNYFFCGPRTEQYRQVGNAVPPLFARELAKSVARMFERDG